MNRIRQVLLGGELDPEVLEQAERSTFVRIDEPLRQYSSFFMRLVVAAIIATAGVAADSATTIIGAMLVAPLMSPMLGTALAVAIGRPGESAQSVCAHGARHGYRRRRGSRGHGDHSRRC